MSEHTPRQEAAFVRYKLAVEEYWTHKRSNHETTEAGRHSWAAHCRHLRDLVDNSEDELFASIIDDLPGF